MAAMAAMRDKKQAKIAWRSLLKTTTPQGRTYLQQCQRSSLHTLQHFGHSRDARITTIKLTDEERQLLDGFDFQEFMEANHHDANSCHGFSRTPIRLDATLLQHEEFYSHYGFLNHAWTQAFISIINKGEFNEWDSDAERASVFHLRSLMNQEGGSNFEDFQNINMRDVLLFNRVQQLRWLDARNDFINHESLAIQFILRETGKLPVLRMLLVLMAKTLWQDGFTWARVEEQPIAVVQDVAVASDLNVHEPLGPTLYD